MRLTTTDHIHTLHRSPIILAPILHEFYGAVQETKNNILLSYLVLPFVLHAPTTDYLLRVSARNSLRTMCSTKTRVAGLHKRVNSLREVTNTCLMSLMTAGFLAIDDELVIRPTTKTLPSPRGLENQMVSAKRLAQLFEDGDAPYLYKLLGISQL